MAIFFLASQWQMKEFCFFCFVYITDGGDKNNCITKFSNIFKSKLRRADIGY